MGLDIRIPLGLIFLITGGMMSIYGLITRGNAAIYENPWASTSTPTGFFSCSALGPYRRSS